MLIFIFDHRNSFIFKLLRKGYIILLLYLLLVYGAAAQQNLVPNPSFEDYIDCPTDVSGMPYSNDYTTFETVLDWANPVRYTSPDYYNRCAAPNSRINIPYNITGYQEPRTGDAYTGIVAYNKTTSPTMERSEYIYCKLASKLSAGVTYNVSFYISATHNGDEQGGYSAVDVIGAALSDTITHNNSSFLLSMPYHIRNQEGIFLDDTSSWTLVSGTYVAKGGEEYLTIGRFDNGTPIKTKPYFTQQSANILSYYYIDDVSVSYYAICDTLYNTHYLCSQSSYTLNSSVDDADSYTWSSGLDGKSINVFEPGIYWCAATKDTCDYYIDSFIVTNEVVTTDTVKQLTICQHDSLQILLLSSLSNADKYTWNTGSTIDQVVVIAPGVYTCIAENDCRVHTDTFKINPIPFVDSLSLGIDTSICEGLTYNIGTPISDTVSYTWNTGSEECCLTIDKTGEYILSATDGCTNLSDTVNVKFFDCSKDCLWTPTAFTPNGDGRNDFFRPVPRCPITEYEIHIFNRWGEQIFTSTDATDAWDGKQEGFGAEIGTYLFFIKYTTEVSTETELVKGEVTLLR